MKTVQTQRAIIALVDGSFVEYRDDLTLVIDDVTGVTVWQPASELASYQWHELDENVGIVWAP